MNGCVDPKTAKLAYAAGIDLRGGYLDSRGRVRIRVGKENPCAWPSGYTFRYRAVWWLRTGEVVVGARDDIHHKNDRPTDDRFRNLERMSHGEHSRLHHTKEDIECECKNCGETFGMKRWRLHQRENRGSYCSQKCYHAKRTDEHRAAISKGLKAAYQHGRR